MLPPKTDGFTLHLNIESIKSIARNIDYVWKLWHVIAKFHWCLIGAAIFTKVKIIARAFQTRLYVRYFIFSITCYITDSAWKMTAPINQCKISNKITMKVRKYYNINIYYIYYIYIYNINKYWLCMKLWINIRNIFNLSYFRIILFIHYCPNINLASKSISHIIKDINSR